MNRLPSKTDTTNALLTQLIIELRKKPNEAASLEGIEINLSGMSTEEKQNAIISTLATLLTEMQKKADNDEAQPVSQEGLIERTVFNVLKRLNVDASGRLRVSSEATVISSGTVTAVTTLANLTNWGLTTATAKSQWEGHQQYQMGFRRNLVHS